MRPWLLLLLVAPGLSWAGPAAALAAPPAPANPADAMGGPAGAPAAAPRTPAAWSDPRDGYFPNFTGSSDPERAIRRTVLGLAERSHALPFGALDQLDGPEGPEAQSDAEYRWARSTGDLDGDGTNDLIVHQVDAGTLRSKVFAASGRNNHVLWVYDNGLEIGGLLWPRFGDSFANAPYNARPAADLNGDGAEDVVVVKMDVILPLPPVVFELGVGVILIEVEVAALNGRTGQAIWREAFTSTIAWEQYDPYVLVILNYPTGWLYVDTPQGPRVVYKTTDVIRHVTLDPVCWLTGRCLFWIGDTLVTEHVKLLDAKDNRHVIWTRDILPTYDARHTMYTWLTGVADLGRGPEPDIVLDQWLETRPFFTEYRNPLTGDPITKYGRGMRMLALDGQNGHDLWSTLIFDESHVRVNALPEEPFEELVWTGGQVLGDLTGDGVHDPLALYLTVDTTSPGTTTGQFRTHFVPVDGKTGRRLWEDMKYQGWGFGASLATPGHNPRLLAVGTVDFLTGAPPGGRFPPHDVHIAVIGVDDKHALWDFSYRFSQDNGLAYQLTLHQFYYNLAPYDWDRDGVLDIVTPAQYVKPSGANQTLLATSKHTYQILGGRDRSELYKFAAWGPFGIVANCAFPDGSLALAIGHSRRVDLVKLDVQHNQEVRRQPVYFDERPRPATAGVNLLNLGVLCDASRGREVVSVNLETFALGDDGDGGRTTAETHSVITLFDAFGALGWMDPPLRVEVPLTPSLELPVPRIQAAAWWQSSDLLLVPAGILPGAVLGVALRVVHVRRNGKKGGELP